MESQIIEFRVVVKFLTKRVQTPKKTIGAWLMCMVIVAQSILQWQGGQQNKRNSLENNPRSGRSADVISQEMINRFERLVNQKLSNLLQNAVFLMNVFTLLL